MNLPLRILLSFLFIPLLISCSGSRQSRGEALSDSVSGNEISDLTKEASIYADSILSTLSLEQKAAQLFIPAVFASSDSLTNAMLQDYAKIGVGGVLLLRGDAASALYISDSIVVKSKIPPFVAIDAEWGLAMRLVDAPAFPVNSGIGEKVNENLMYDYGREMARECRKLGINVILGPVMDIAETGFISKRSFGNDPERVAALSLAYSRGLVSGNVMCVAKHFPGHGAVGDDSHKNKPVIEKSLHSIDSIDLLPFRMYVEEGLPAVMVGHLAFPAIDPEMLPAAVSKTVITDLLREDMGFRGLVFTDALNMAGAEGYGADKAIEAGADILLVPRDTKKSIGEVIDAIKEGRLEIEELNDRVRRILFYKYLFSIDSKDAVADSLLETEETRRIRTELLR